MILSVAIAIMPIAATTVTGATAEQVCQSALARAAGKHAQCLQKALAKFELTGSDLPDSHVYNTQPCTDRYVTTWEKLNARFSGTGTTCGQPRLIDNGDGTVIDLLTGLQWEKKDNLDSARNYSDPHDGDNDYTWSSSGVAADGTSFTDFLARLNTGACFAGECDWRLPTRDELDTIWGGPNSPVACFTDASVACVDPIFGPTQPLQYWTSSSVVGDPASAWTVAFNVNVRFFFQLKTDPFFVRAVRSR